MWLATVANRDWPSRPGLTADQQRAELIAHLDRAVAARLNTVIFQVRPTADALWPSPYEPWSQYLTGTQGKDPGWDPLGTAVEEAHAAGSGTPRLVQPVPHRQPRGPRPGWPPPTPPARTRTGWCRTAGSSTTTPGCPRSAPSCRTRCSTRYSSTRSTPSTSTTTSTRTRWRARPSTTTRPTTATAAVSRTGPPGGGTTSTSWCGRRRPGIKGSGPARQFGISPFGVWRNADTDPLGSDTRAGVQTYDDLYADTRKWVREGWIDYIVPAALLEHRLRRRRLREAACPGGRRSPGAAGRKLYLGEALYKAGDPAQPAAWQDPAELSRHLTLAERSPAGARARLLRGQGGRRRPDRRDGAGGRRPLPAAGDAPALSQLAGCWIVSR